MPSTTGSRILPSRDGPEGVEDQFTRSNWPELQQSPTATRTSAMGDAGPVRSQRVSGSIDTGSTRSVPSPQAHSASPGGPKQTANSPTLMDPPIYFYDKDKPHYGFTNFSDHSIMFNGRLYPTSEHLFQSFKFQKEYPQLAEHIRTFSDKPSDALSEARRLKLRERRDWFSVNKQKMDETLWLKFTQHPDLLRELLSTGDAELIEDSDKDDFWGIGKKRDGRNELGKALVRLRSKLRDSGYY